MSPNVIEALGLLLAVLGVAALSLGAALVYAPLGYLVAGLIGLVFGVQLVLLANRAPAPTQGSEGQ